jgi:arsenite methyltransferase
MQACQNSIMTKLRRRGEYGFDGNMTGLLGTTAVTAALLMAAAALALGGFVGTADAVMALMGAPLLTTLGIYVHTTRRGKFLVWAEILDSLRLRGDERVLDVGCGRGGVLTMIAERLPRGRAVGIDLWTADQSGNSAEAAESNLVAEGVRERCELVTGDMRSMPFPDASFDLIISSLAIHNIGNLAGRSRAIDEIARALAPDGHVAIADLAWTRVYVRRLESLGFIDVRRRRLGWRFWWGPAFPTTTLVTGTKRRPPN